MLGIVDGRDEISGGGFADRRGVETFSSVVVLQRVEIAGLVANVHPAERLRVICLGVKLDELAVVDLDEGLGGFAGVGNGEGLLVAELAEKDDFAIEVADAKRNVRDADDAFIWRGRLRDQSCRAGEDERKWCEQAEFRGNSQKNLQSPLGAIRKAKTENGTTAG